MKRELFVLGMALIFVCGIFTYLPAKSHAQSAPNIGECPVSGCPAGQYCSENDTCLVDSCSGGGSTPAFQSTGLSAASSTPCVGPINSMSSAQACADLAQDQGAALGYTVSCHVVVTTGNPLTGTTYDPECTVNGVPNQEAYSLAGEKGAAYTVNSSWCGLNANLAQNQAETTCGVGNAVYTTNGWVCEAGAEFRGSCSVATGCGGGLVCEGGQCEEPTSCTASSTCGYGEVCTNGECLYPEATAPTSPTSPTAPTTGTSGNFSSALAAAASEIQCFLNNSPGCGALADNIGITQSYTSGTTPPASTSETTPQTTPTTPGFPTSVLVTTASLNVRSGPSTSDPLAGSMTLQAGDTFTAIGAVTGESVDGNDVWLESSLGHYVWSEGTSLAGTAAVAGANAIQAAAPASNPSISSASWNEGEGILTIQGLFDPSGNIVFVNGQQLSNNGEDQTATLLQLVVTGGTGNSPASVINAVSNPPYTVTVQDSEGSASFTVNPPPPSPILNSVQGYNPTTNKYETQSGVMNAGDTYLILYGSFSPATATQASFTTSVVINNSTILPQSDITYQSSTQMNVIIPANVLAAGTFTIYVSNIGGSSKTLTVTASGSGGSVPAILPKLTVAQLQSAITSAGSFSGAVDAAENAGYLVYVSDDGEGSASAIVRDPITTDVVAAFGEEDD